MVSPVWGLWPVCSLVSTAQKDPKFVKVTGSPAATVSMTSFRMLSRMRPAAAFVRFFSFAHMRKIIFSFVSLDTMITSDFFLFSLFLFLILRLDRCV